jgi:hypothetical protein
MKQHKYEAGPCCRKFVGSRRERLLPAGAGLNKHLEITNLVCVCVCVCVCVLAERNKSGAVSIQLAATREQNYYIQ